MIHGVIQKLIFLDSTHVVHPLKRFLLMRVVSFQSEKQIDMGRGSVIHWFRKGLRLHDNPALLASLKPVDGQVLSLRPVFVLDPWFVQNATVGANRWRFLVQSLKDLDTSLRSLGSRLYVVRGSPDEVFPRVFDSWKVRKITWEIDTEPYALARDEKIEKLAQTRNLEVETFTSHTLFHPERIIAKNKGEVPLTFQKLCSVLKSLGPPSKPVGPPGELPNEAKCPIEDLDDSTYDVPSLSEVGVKEEDMHPCLFPGGETEGVKRLDDKISMKRAAWVRAFEKPNTSPNSLKPSTTVLSPYLKFGCVSVRRMYWQLEDIYKGSKHSQPPVSLHGQILWREFYYTVGYGTPNFDRMVGNKVCRQIPWDDDPVKLAAWAEGRTGYPWIDAIMIQLRREGWIHHLARHSVACFLTRGDLWQSWEAGQKVFDELLLDADWNLNAGNWMWLSASAFFHQFFRCYSPVAFGKKTDKEGEYIKKYLPILKKFPAKYIYEPWEAPLSVQQAAGCVIGKDYPKRIVDHQTVVKENMGKMKEAYDKHKAGKAGSSNNSSPAKGNKTTKSKSQPTTEAPKTKKRKKIDSFFTAEK